MQALVVNDELGSSGNAFTVWPKEIFKLDFEVISQVGQGQFGKVFSVKRKKRTDDDTIYAAKFITCKGASSRLKVRDEMDLVSCTVFSTATLVHSFNDSIEISKKNSVPPALK